MVDCIKQKYHTIFGFDTTHKVSAKAIDIIYWVIIGAGGAGARGFVRIVAF